MVSVSVVIFFSTSRAPPQEQIYCSGHNKRQYNGLLQQFQIESGNHYRLRYLSDSVCSSTENVDGVCWTRMPRHKVHNLPTSNPILHGWPDPGAQEAEEIGQNVIQANKIKILGPEKGKSGRQVPLLQCRNTNTFNLGKADKDLGEVLWQQPLEGQLKDFDRSGMPGEF